MFYFNLIYLLIMVIMILVGAAFLTLLERKILGYIQIRKGPNKVGIKGMLQPFSDAIKLFSKEYMYLDKINLYMYMLGPMIMLVISMLYWLLMPYYTNWMNFKFGLVFLFLMLSLSVYPSMMMGWSSNSIYAMLGCLRSISQSISFEVSLFFMFFIIMMFIEGFSLELFTKFQFNINFFFLFFPLYLMLIVSMMIELNRAPFDLIEGESELVSGFNVEYYSSSFSLIFMAEYMMILFMSLIMVIIFFNFGYSILTLLMILYHNFFFIWIRSIMPRIRYDELMYMCWKKFLSFILIYMYMIFILKMLMNLYM
uniref:NADH-ubiquinone oxidoreductase chain 1 n=1 Tax=Osmia pedicornis TaxID=124293 RepID=A0A7G9XFI3_9HYME|nr:NADH dehydrogenase subunit 1 [Osmia pedicornis]